MAVTPYVVPDTYALSRSARTLFRFTGDGRTVTTGVKSFQGLWLKEAVPDGTIIKLAWNGQTQQLIARTNPTLPTEFPAGNGSSAHGDQLVNYFKSYFPFRKDFVVTKADFGLTTIINFTARKAGSVYTMSQILAPGLGSLPAVSGPLDLGVVTPGADALVRERYGVYIETYLQRRGTDGDTEDDFDLIDVSHVECDETGDAKFDVGEVLHGYLSADLPNFTAQGGQVALDSHRKYYVAYGEAWGQPVEPALIQNDTIRHIYLGGADFEHRSGVGFSLPNFLKGTSAATDRAMRFGPTARVIHIDEPAFLTFVNLRDETDSVSLKVLLTFDDDETAQMTGIQAVIPYAPGEKVCFPVGVAILDLLSQVPTGKNLKEYSVQLKGQGTNVFLSRPYRYIIDYSSPDYRRYFQYLNSLGAFINLMTYGRGSSQLERVYDQAEKFLEVNYESSDAQYVDYNIALQQSFEVTSGWQEQKELASWNDFYSSPIRLQVSGQKIYAIGLTSKTIKQFKDGDAQFAHNFSYIHLHHDEFYTDDETPDGDEHLPAIVVPVGTVVVTPIVVTPVIDPTIPAAVRELTPVDIAGFKASVAWGNHSLAGYLTQTSGSALFRRKDLQIPYSELVNTPTSRDSAGLLDVPTIKELFDISHIKPSLSSWIGSAIPAEQN